MAVFLFAFMALTNLAVAQDVVEYFDHAPNHEIGPISVPELNGKHSKCLEVDGEVSGDEVRTPVRLASVTKLVTSYWALKTLGHDFRFQTRIAHEDGTLYIDTSGDPFFSRDRVFFLIAELNKKGIQSVDRVEFPRTSIFLIPVEDRDYRFTELGPADGPSQRLMREQLLPILQTGSWNNEIKEHFRKFKNKMRREGLDFPTNITFSADEIRWVSQERDTQWVSHSPPLMRYLKLFNQNSLNFIGDRLFHIMGGKYAMEDFLGKDNDLNQDPFEFFTGSGLNVGQGFHRLDNYASCFFMLTLMKKLKAELESKEFLLEDLFFAVGLESGTLNPGPNSPWSGRLYAKTGTLKNAVAFAGFMRTRRGLLPFGLFYQTGDRSAARRARNRQVDRWFDTHGLGRKRPYQPTRFLAVDSTSYFTTTEKRLR